MQISEVVVLVLGAVACWCDLRTRRIPNTITFGGAAVAIAYSIVANGAGGLLGSIGGWLTGVALFLPFLLLGGMGAGDVKLLACFGAWLGPWMALWVALYAAMAGGVMAVVLALATGYLRQATSNIMLLLMHWRTSGVKPLPQLTLEGSRGPRLPYALPLAIGAAVAIWFR